VFSVIVRPDLEMRMHQELTDYFRCPEECVDFTLSERLSDDAGFFCAGKDTVCYGRSAVGFRARSAASKLYDVLDDVRYSPTGAELPFDPSEIAQNLRYERYANPPLSSTKKFVRSAVRNSYYFLRPLMPVPVRKHLQKAHLKGWKDIPFPKWPVDTSVDSLLQKLLAISIRSRGGEAVPFIWFWPEGKRACAVMTHDVEQQGGVDYCSRLMDINTPFEVFSSFQVVPEKRYPVPAAYLESIRSRGFEVNVHDLNHDGQLYWDHEEFKRRAAKINQYGREFGARGFRAGVLYRNQEWFDLLDFEYDMSVPNVAHLDPQRGGCCTVMPFFVGKILELPVTAVQDYSLFNILNDYSLNIWERQIEIILRNHGLLNIIVHPDYLVGEREEDAYKGLLGLYARLRRDHDVWIPLPRDANAWWRQRARMRLVKELGSWRIEGEGSERAVLAFAGLENDQLTYRLSDASGRGTRPAASEFVPATV
jgi:hypothetical protein